MKSLLPANTRKTKPKILFLHRSFGGQFEFFGGWLAQCGWDVTYGYCADHGENSSVPGTRSVQFQIKPTEIPKGNYRYILDFSASNALGVAEMIYRMRNLEGYTPDIVIAHVGWGVGLCVKQVWPESTYIAYHEWFYTGHNWDNSGKREKPALLAELVSERMLNLPITAEFDAADANWCPTKFQASRFPPMLRQFLTIISDGVDCDTFHPDPDAKIDFSWLSLPKTTKILTYATRGMEPVRGFPQFMNALQLLQKRRDDFHTVVLANEQVSYGEQLPAGESWRLRMLDRLDIDQSRLHIFGMRPRQDYQRVLQASSVHCYFSEPFVTSWSLSEALATGCMVVGSDTAPVKELVTNMSTGVLVDMDDPEEVADIIEWTFDHPSEVARLRKRARALMLRDYNSQIVFPEKERILRELARL